MTKTIYWYEYWFNKSKKEKEKVLQNNFSSWWTIFRKTIENVGKYRDIKVGLSPSKKLLLFASMIAP